MAENLTEKDFQLIKSIIDAWPSNERLTWEALIDNIARHRHGKAWSRQALSRHAEILDAYKLRKKRLRSSDYKPGYEQASPELKAALNGISTLESEILRLEHEIIRFKEMFVVWSYNAHSLNITEEKLNKPLPEQIRGKSKK